MDGPSDYDGFLDAAINEVLDETTVKFRIPVGKPDTATQYAPKVKAQKAWQGENESNQYEDPRMHQSYPRRSGPDAAKHQRYQEDIERPAERSAEYKGRSYRPSEEAQRPVYEPRYYYDEKRVFPLERKESFYHQPEGYDQHQAVERREAPTSKPKFNGDRFTRDEDLEGYQTHRQVHERDHQTYDKHPTQRQPVEDQAYGRRERPYTAEQPETADLPDPSKVKLPKIIPRARWGALPSMRRIDTLTAPADTLVFTFDTNTPSCSTEEECGRRVRELQARYMGKGMADIKYNFLMGGDGNLYEGRGWALQSGVPKQGKEGHNYNIAFIGQYFRPEDVPKHMITTVQNFVDYAKAHRIIVRPPGQKEGNKRLDRGSEIY